MRLVLAVLAALLAAIPPAAAQAWPSKPVRIVVPYPPGGPADALGRLLASQLAEVWGQPVVVDNRGGAAGNIGAQLVAKSPNDGSTLLLHASSHVINGVLYKKPGYDPIADFTPVSQVAYYMLVVVVHPAVPIASLPALIQAAKAEPGRITYGSAGGAGAPTHLAVELFKRAAGIDLLHVPYAGAGPATTALVGGHINMMFNNPLSVLPHVASGGLRAIAVTGAARLPQLPDTPTVAELGFPGFEVGTWYGIWGPAGMAPDVTAAAHAGIAKVLAMQSVREKLAQQGLDTLGTTPAELDRIARAELARWGEVIRAANITVD